MSSGLAIPLAVVGCDFRVAASRARSRLVLDEHESLEIAAELERGGWAQGVALLDTCNRSEWIVVSDQPAWAAQLLLGRMRQRLDPEQRLRVEPYLYTGEDAARHLFAVAIGQESLVVGERQIAGQLFRALDRARVRGTSCRVLNGLGSIGGRLVRIALRRGCLEGSAVGVHSLAIAWLRRELEPGPRSVAVVGLGSIGRRVAGILDEDPRFRTLRCNRTVTPGSAVRPLEALPQLLAEVDAAVVCSSAPRPLVLPAELGARPLVLVDIGIPEQVGEPQPGGPLRRVGLDDLVRWHQAQAGEQDESIRRDAQALVERAVGELGRYCQEPAFTPVLEVVRERHRTLTADEVPRVLEQLTDLSAEQRSRLEAELRTLLAGYTADVMQVIRDRSRQLSENESWNDAK